MDGLSAGAPKEWFVVAGHTQELPTTDNARFVVVHAHGMERAMVAAQQDNPGFVSVSALPERQLRGFLALIDRHKQAVGAA